MDADHDELATNPFFLALLAQPQLLAETIKTNAIVTTKKEGTQKQSKRTHALKAYSNALNLGGVPVCALLCVLCVCRCVFPLVRV